MNGVVEYLYTFILWYLYILVFLSNKMQFLRFLKNMTVKYLCTI
jgi:hypothetical protein